MRSGRDTRVVRAVEEHRRRLEQVEDEDEDADRQDEQLQRDLDEGAHHQRATRFVFRFRRQITLHLALVAAEIREHQEQPADHARPERVGFAQIEFEVHRMQPPGRAGEVHRLSEADVAGDAHDEHHDSREHAGDDDHHLLDVGPRHRLHAADAGVENHRNADDEHGDLQLPAENRGDDDRRRGQRHAERKRAAHEKQKARERSHADIEPPLEILVRRVDLRAVEKRHGRHRQDDHRERQAEIELDESQAGEVRLSGCADERDRAHLRRHHREPDGPPRQRPVAEKITFDFVRPLRSPQPVVHNPHEVDDDDGPVERAHGLGKHPAEDDQRDDDSRFEKNDADVGASHQPRSIAWGASQPVGHTGQCTGRDPIRP